MTMKRLLLLLGFLYISQGSFAQEVEESEIDEVINESFQPITNSIVSVVFVSFDFPVGDKSVSVPFIVFWLFLGAIFFTLYFRFINFRKFGLAINIVRGKYDKLEEQGEVSHFQALTAALSGTVGLGNIAGVAIAISLGGPGATFWMILVGLLGMSTKFAECTLGVKYREIDENGTVHGGPMYYLKKGFTELKMTIDGQDKNYSKMGKVLAAIFAVLCIGGSFGGGNMFQINQAYKQFSNQYLTEGDWLMANGWAFGLIIAVLVGIVIIGGIKSIAKVTDKIVPFMCGVYVLAALVIIVYHYDKLGSAFGAIFSGAFNFEAGFGGFVGTLIIGIKRAAFSNEAGVGSASIAHSAVKTDDPASEGIVALLEPFIDTVVVCTMTALVIIITGEYQSYSGGGTEVGVSLTSNAFASVLTWFPHVLTLAVLLFAFSTMVSWSYYGLQAWQYLFGKSKEVEIAYKIIFCAFIVVGAPLTLGAVTDFSDMMILAMSFPNIIGLIFLTPIVKSELNKYLEKIRTFTTS